jgi:basic membrane protein A and related proteins
MKKLVVLISLVVMVLSVAPLTMAQDIESICLITDIGRLNDGGFNQGSNDGAVAAAEEFDLDYTFIETQAETDYDANIQTCVEEGYDIIVTVGFLITNAATEAAIANPDVYFIGVDQFITGGPSNQVGVQFREDQSGFLAGVLAALVAESLDSDTVAGVYGMEIPPVKKFRNGFEQGAMYINPDINTLGVYIDDFQAPDRGGSAAEQFIGEGASVIFGAGGPTGTGGITAAAQQDVYVIGVDKDEWVTNFGEGETPGSEYIISSAMKRLDRGVYDMVAAVVNGDMDAFPGGEIYVMDVALEGVGMADKHEADVDDEIYEQVAEVQQLMIDGEVETGVDPASGDLLDDMDMMEPEATEEASD